MATVVVALSGGVDSSVAAALLKQSGFDVVGAHIICWDGCDIKEEKRDALRVSLHLGIPFLTFDFRQAYRQRVFDYMIREYAEGKTPNPDVRCNSEIKFGLFLEKSLQLGANYIATGHYARLADSGDQPELWEAADKSKDQSYFLWALDHRQLRHALFPLASYTKPQVRQIARESGLPTAEKKDSQGLCFVGRFNFGNFLREHLPVREGAVINSCGQVIGKHDGVSFYTVGQRHGLGIGGKLPYYVAEKNIATNALVVGQGRDDPIMFKKEIWVHRLNRLSDFRSDRCQVRIRYRQPKVSARIEAKGDRIRVDFNVPQRGVAPGQSAVFYDQERLLGGGVIL